MEPLKVEDFDDIDAQLTASVEEDKKYWKVNSVKCDAIQTAKTYEEFADRVAAAHLNPLGQCDYKKRCNRKWNQYATDERKPDDEYEYTD
uniref:Dynein attachment factor N-terminal domain-containing protein n=1 Tax=Heliothis virescens TaxID=7102 RepID=A0A2A4JWY4_HELVI